MSSLTSTSRRQFIKLGVAGAVGFGIASAIEIPLLSNTLQNNDAAIKQKDDQINQLQSQIQQIPQLQKQVSATEDIRTFTTDEASELEAIVETIIPTDENGPGAKEAGVLYFIDHELASTYGNNARMYMKPPFVLSGHSGPLTVDGILYPDGSEAMPYGGPRYQFDMLLRDFWKTNLKDFQDYVVATYGDKFENLSNDQKVQALTDLYNDKPTTFHVDPLDFFYELMFMTWSGFFMDPVYGGNRDMVGWKLTGFVGTNTGNAYGEGLNTQQLMVAASPTRLQPASLGQYQKTLGLIGGT